MKIKPTYVPFLAMHLLSFIMEGQVGIKTQNPQATLDVNGDVRVEKKLYLENPGDFGIIRGSNLLIQKTDLQIAQYDIEISKYGPINYAQFIFENVGDPGITFYDTKISTEHYLVTVQGYYFLENGTNATSVVSYSDNGDDYVEGYQIYAYKSPATNTWFIKAVINNGGFRNSTEVINVDMYLNLIIYRNRFIAKQITNRVVNLGGSATGTAALPAGF
ncbi:hypothetical protein [uncultured Marixanthomonas sp.]|uniref:hypothetical protein n=1 Tax=uncultured Marixanthomonas sp. TaxID=757245 RepID=UPI0030DA5DF8|tara:strand:+ start:6448 stop:7101 length:654 start_codon:yes stop_codon:yes gene_type:complete